MAFGICKQPNCVFSVGVKGCFRGLGNLARLESITRAMIETKRDGFFEEIVNGRWALFFLRVEGIFSIAFAALASFAAHSC